MLDYPRPWWLDFHDESDERHLVGDLTQAEIEELVADITAQRPGTHVTFTEA